MLRAFVSSLRVPKPSTIPWGCYHNTIIQEEKQKALSSWPIYFCSLYHCCEPVCKLALLLQKSLGTCFWHKSVALGKIVTSYTSLLHCSIKILGAMCCKTTRVLFVHNNFCSRIEEEGNRTNTAEKKTNKKTQPTPTWFTANPGKESLKFLRSKDSMLALPLTWRMLQPCSPSVKYSLWR